jgi:CheY-like chemotaxis protein
LTVPLSDSAASSSLLCTFLNRRKSCSHVQWRRLNRPQRGPDSKRRILVTDDGDSVRDAIRIFSEHAGFEVCGKAADGVQAIEQAKKLKPDLIVLDLAMPRMNGAEAASVLNTTMPKTPIVLLTLYRNLLGTAPRIRYRRQSHHRQNRRTRQAGQVHSFFAECRICPEAA